MNRNRFIAPPVENRATPVLFTTPPPNFNWQRGPAPTDYTMQTNAPSFQNPQTQPILPPFNQNPLKKNYCKTCNLWTIEPYESHKTSSSHMANINTTNNTIQQYPVTSNVEQNGPNKYPIRPNSQPYEPLANTEHHIPRNVNTRNNGQPFEPMVSQDQNMQRNGNLRNNLSQHDQINTPLSHMPRKGTSRVTVPTFKIADNPNSTDNMVDNGNNKKNKKEVRKTKNSTNQQNPANFQNVHSGDGTFIHSHDSVVHTKLEDKVKIVPITTDTNVPITANIGREMLLPVSGVYCTLCDQFFRNTDTAETNHCKSSTHIDAYEKLLGQLNPACEKRSLSNDSQNDKPSTKRSKNTDKTIKPFKLHASIEKKDSLSRSEADVSVGVGEMSSRSEIVDFDQTSSSEFQGPDVSLEFPDDIEDYDE